MKQRKREESWKNLLKEGKLRLSKATAARNMQEIEAA